MLHNLRQKLRIFITIKYRLYVSKLFKLSKLKITMVNPVNQNQQLANYIKKNMTKGYTADSLKFSLMTQGYSRTSVEKAIELANKQLAESAPKMVEKPTVKYEVIDSDEMAAKVAAQERPGFFGRLFGFFKKKE
jgi:hypothetical protein